MLKETQTNCTRTNPGRSLAGRGFSPVCVRWWAFKCELLVYTFRQPLNWQRWILFLFSGSSPTPIIMQAAAAASSSSSFTRTSLAALRPTLRATSLRVSVPSADAVSAWPGLIRWRPSSGEDGGVKEVTALSWAWWTPLASSRFSRLRSLALRSFFREAVGLKFLFTVQRMAGGGLSGCCARLGRSGSRVCVSSSSSPSSSFR